MRSERSHRGAQCPDAVQKPGGEGFSLQPRRALRGPPALPRLPPARSLPSLRHLGHPVEIAELRRPFPSGGDVAEDGDGGEGRPPPPSRRATECLLCPSPPSSLRGSRGGRQRRRGGGSHAAGRPPLPGNARPSAKAGPGRRGRGGPGVPDTGPRPLPGV